MLALSTSLEHTPSITIRPRTGSRAHATARALASTAARSRNSAGPIRLIVRYNVLVNAIGSNKVLRPRSIAMSDIAVAPSANARIVTASMVPG